MSVNEEADRLRLLIVGSACGALLRNHAEIVLAYVNRQSPQSAAHPFPQDSHSLGPRCHVFSLRGEDSGRKGFVRPERPEGGHHIGNRLAWAASSVASALPQISTGPQTPHHLGDVPFPDLVSLPTSPQRVDALIGAVITGFPCGNDGAVECFERVCPDRCLVVDRRNPSQVSVYFRHT